MALALTRENFFWHKVHSLTGIVPVGYYMVQHLVLNTFTLAPDGEAKFNSIINFFEAMPKHFLLTLEITAIWLPLLFHAVYGLFIVSRAEPNLSSPKYNFAENRMYTFQRWSGIFIFAFLLYHVISTTGAKYYYNNAELIKYTAWQEKLTSYGYIFLLIYALGVLTSSYHLAYGVWNFSIRWGITISDQAQLRVRKASVGIFVVLTLLGWGALTGFLIHKPAEKQAMSYSQPSSAPESTTEPAPL